MNADYVDTTGYCFKTGFWDSELVSTHRWTVSTPLVDCVDTQADCVDTTALAQTVASVLFLTIVVLPAAQARDVGRMEDQNAEKCHMLSIGVAQESTGLLPEP
ncbi:hypothetical protein Taro_022459 [Colocasia esculenta]|uniref:Uncharacterized protein n=1 Tax=Colocasia esculenta TaxID=4460 RepID=A0A843V1F4_COLES|nr:hypothetical protein [Colocasia esculenta]